MKVACHTRPWAERFAAGREAIRDAGYSAVESFCLSQWFGRSAAFRESLAAEGLELAAMEYGGDWTGPDRAGVETEGVHLLAEFLAETGAGVIVVSGGRRAAEGASVELFRGFAMTMNELGEGCRARGVRLCYHPKPGTLIEYRDQIERFMESTDPARVSLCLDTGDLARAGCDPLEAARSLGARVGHVHLKDLNWRTHDPVPPGAGALDLRGVLDELRKHGYAGWITVELDRPEDPLGAARASRQFLRDALGC